MRKLLAILFLLAIYEFASPIIVLGMSLDSLFLGMKINADNEYVIRNNYDLSGAIVELPEFTSLVFEGGSINNGTIILHDNCSIKGRKNTKLKANCKINGKSVSHQALFLARSCKNIHIKDIIIVGNYSETMGNINPWMDNSCNSQSLLFFKDCCNLTLDNVTISNFYNPRSSFYKTWNETYHSEYNMFPVYFFNCDNIKILECKEINSCGEAWTIMNSRKINIDGFFCKQKFATSVLSVIYCSDIKLINSHFEVIHALGNLVNITAENFKVSHCSIIGGDLDFGNEHANVDIDLNDDGFVGDNNEYVISKAQIINNNIINGCITNNTSNRITNEYSIDDIIIANNHIEINVSTQASLRGINLGSYGSIRKCSINNNYISFFGEYNETFASNSDYRYIPIVVFKPNYKVKQLRIANNEIIDNAIWNRSISKTMAMTETLGSSILVNIRSGNVMVKGNKCKTLYDMNITQKKGMNISLSNNRYISKY